MTIPQKHAGKKSLIAAFMRLLTGSSAPCKKPQSNQSIHNDHTPPVHILSPHQGAIQYNSLKNRIWKTFPFVKIINNGRKYTKEALQKHTRKQAKTHSKKKCAKKEMCISHIKRITKALLSV